ncbi:hypothetical protein R6Q57_005841 [Mikania cordata]
MARDSCLARVTAGVAVGGAVGGAVGAVYGTYEAVRYKVWSYNVETFSSGSDFSENPKSSVLTDLNMTGSGSIFCPPLSRPTLLIPLYVDSRERKKMSRVR